MVSSLKGPAELCGPFSTKDTASRSKELSVPVLANEMQRKEEEERA